MKVFTIKTPIFVRQLLLKVILILPFILAAPSPVHAVITGTAKLRVIPPLVLNYNDTTNNLRFGDFAATSAGTITQSGVVSSGISYLGGAQAASFFVTGSASRAYTITVDSAVTLTRSGGSETMSASLSIPGGTSRTIGTGGTGSFNVNGTLNVAANQVVGAYTGVYNLTVAY